MHAIFTRLNTVLLFILVLMAATIIAILATRAGAGPLDPPGPPSSTMHTLDEVYTTANNVPQSWDRVLNSTNGAPGPINPPTGCNSDRFKCVMNYSQCGQVCQFVYPAVLDEETGLVWQRSLSSTIYTWLGAYLTCGNATTGGRDGWRLPTPAELLSLVSPSGGFAPGHPFAGSNANFYWTSTEVVGNPGAAIRVQPSSAFVTTGLEADAYSALCVRGATGGR